MKLFLLILLLSISAIFSNLFAQNSSPIEAKLLLEAGIHYGGDVIMEVEFQDGGDQEMLAGQGLTLAVGGQLSMPSFKYVFMRGSIGFKYSTTAADNANIMFLRYPLNIMAYAAPVDDIRIGIGTTSHLGAVLKGDGFFRDIEYESSFGPRFEVGYKWVALVYNNITFTDPSGDEYKGGAFGLTFSGTLPQ